MGEISDWTVVIEHDKADSWPWEFGDWDVKVLLGTLEVSGKFTGFWDKEISAVVDITEGVSTNDNWLGPVVDESWDVFAENWLSEDGSSKIISDGSVGWFPHFFELELFDSGFIGSDGSALDTNFAIFDGFGGIHSDLIVGLVSVFDTEVKVLNVQIQKGMDELILDLLPEDSSHFITIKFGDWVFDFDFLGSEAVWAEGSVQGGELFCKHWIW